MLLFLDYSCAFSIFCQLFKQVDSFREYVRSPDTALSGKSRHAVLHTLSKVHRMEDEL